MTAFEPFAHYLAYGATDQETFRELRDAYDGVLVPATIAAYQRKGTGGFVLSLSATEQAPPYLIDSRFPLFQQTLTAPKKSHTALAELLDDPNLVRTLTDPTPEDFSDDRIESIAKRWVDFNIGYGQKENATFDKYAKRLGVDVRPERAQNPEAVLAPYFACWGPQDAWWERSQRFYEQTSAATTQVPCRRVVCAREPEALDLLLADLPEPERLVVWVSDLDEHNTLAASLVEYRRAISNAVARGHEPFALYGGFFAVLLGSDGLLGASHGVGFSEHRAWKELPTSGAAPARFYLRRVHRYVTQDLAQALYTVSEDLTECPCEHCAGRPPIALDYHELMKHSVWCRNEEIKRWYRADPEEAAEALGNEFDTISAQIGTSGLPPGIRARARSVLEHLPEWASALRADV
jgi:hypothetical protein